jgi:Ca2+-binding RTX toxin-like protein
LAFVVFAGQSNIGGPFMNASTLSRAWAPDPLSLIWDDRAGQWTPMQPGLNTGYGSLPNAWGPEVEFARDFRAAFPGETLRIVKVAHGGTQLEPDWAQWHYDWSPRSDNELFDSTGATIRAAGASLGGVRPDAVFFGQGEEDAAHAGAAAAYGENLAGFLAAVRAEWMGDAAGKVGFFRINVTPPYAEQVRAAQQQVDQADPNAQSLDAGRYPTYVDGLHYSAAGYDMIGDDFFRLFAGWRAGGDESGGGGPGGHQLNGTPAADTLIGGAGDDAIGGGAGQDFLRGGEGRDLMSGGDAFDDMHGNQGDDTLSGDDGGDWVVGGKDNDRLYGAEGDDIVYGNLGDDLCDGGSGADLIRGGQDQDQLFGWSGNDWLSGDRGNDTISGGSGADIFHSFSEAGLDLVTDFSFAEGDRVQLDPGASYSVAQVGEDVVVDIGAGRLVLQNVQLPALGQGWLFGA